MQETPPDRIRTNMSANQQKLFSVGEFLEETGFGKKIVVGDTIVIRSVSFTDSLYGEVAVLSTDEGRRYTGATALVDFCKRLADNPEFLPMKVTVTEMVSSNGRTYQTFK